MLKRKLTAAEFAALPDALKAYYKQEGDDYGLQVEGMVPKERLEEYRDNNIQHKKDLERFKDIDPDKYRELLTLETDLRAGKLKDGKTVDQIIQERTEAMRKAHETALAAATEAATKASAELTKLKITDAAVTIAQKKGLRATAAEDLKMRAERIFKLNDKGQPVAMDGDKERFGKNGDPLGLDEWLDGLITDAAHLFEPSSGSGSGQGQGGAAGAPGINPWKAGTINLTRQGEIMKKDAALAKRLKAEAGVR